MTDLINEFKKVQTEIQKLTESKQDLTKIKRRIIYLLGTLYKKVDNWTADNIPIMYEDAKTQVLKDIHRAEMRIGAVYDDIAIENAIANVNIYLEQAVDDAQRNMEDFMNGMLDTDADRQRLAEYVADGVPSSYYWRDYKKVFYTIVPYALLVLGNTTHELRNIAAINVTKDINRDLVFMSYHFGSCPICIPYEGRVYSLSGTDPNYPYLYSTPWNETYQNMHPNCRHLITPYIEDLKTPEEIAADRAYSNRSFVVGGQGWTKEQVEQAKKSLEYYRQWQAGKRKTYENRRMYERYKARMGDKAPKTFAAFSRIKSANGKAWEKLQREYRNMLD